MQFVWHLVNNNWTRGLVSTITVVPFYATSTIMIDVALPVLLTYLYIVLKIIITCFHIHNSTCTKERNKHSFIHHTRYWIELISKELFGLICLFELWLIKFKCVWNKPESKFNQKLYSINQTFAKKWGIMEEWVSVATFWSSNSHDA